MNIKKHKNIIVTVLTVIPLLISTFFVFYKNEELYIDLQWKVIEKFGSRALVVFIIFAVLVFIKQAVKIIFRNKSFTKHISQNVLFWTVALESLFVGYMFLNNAGFDKIQSIYFRVVLVILSGIALLFWYPKSRIKNNIPIKAVAIAAALIFALLPLAESSSKETSLTVDPVVFVAGENYQIVWQSNERSIGWLKVGDRIYEDSSGGTMKTLEKVHKVSVPIEELDKAKSYTIYTQKVEREPYVVELGKRLEKAYTFRPIDESDGIQIYNLSDNHSSLFPAADTAGYWGDKLDLLILNGDIANDLMSEDDLVNLINLAAEVTKGNRPVLYTRGNHETRGAYAEQVHKYVGCPSEDEFYFTTKLSGLYIMVLDIAEDKADTHKEYHELARFEAYRDKQTEFIKNVIENKEDEYEAEGVKYKLLISHIRVNNRNNWHEDIHKEWTKYANEIKPDLHLSGHSHRLSYMPPAGDSEYNPDNPDGSYGDASYAHNFTVVMGSQPPRDYNENSDDFIATAVLLKDDSIDLWFTNQNHEIIEHHKVK